MPVATTQTKAAVVIAPRAATVAPASAATFATLFASLSPLQQALVGLYMEERENSYVAAAIASLPPELIVLSRATSGTTVPTSGTGRVATDVYLNDLTGIWYQWSGTAWSPIPPPVPGVYT